MKKVRDVLLEKLYFFNPLYTNSIRTQEEKVKAFIELVYVYNMLFPIYFSVEESKKIENFILHCLNEMSIYKYSLYNKTFGNAPFIIREFLSNVNRDSTDENKIKILEFKNYFEYAAEAPFRKLDNLYAYQKAYGKNDQAILNQKFQLTLAAKQFNPIYLSTDLVYAVTHAIFYISDMGSRTKVLNQNYLKKNLFRWISLYILMDDMDILAEIILCILFLNNRLTDKEIKILNKAIEIIEAHRNKEGYICPSYNSKNKKLSAELMFQENYHTTLVFLGVKYAYEKRNFIK